MLGFIPPVDIESTLVGLLKRDLDLRDLVRDGISTELPANFKAQPWVQLWREGGTTTEQIAKRLDQPRLTANCFGATKAEAYQVSRLFLLAMERSVNNHSNAVITHLDVLIQPYWSREDESDYPRYITLFVVNVHPQR